MLKDMKKSKTKGRNEIITIKLVLKSQNTLSQIIFKNQFFPKSAFFGFSAGQTQLSVSQKMFLVIGTQLTVA